MTQYKAVRLPFKYPYVRRDRGLGLSLWQQLSHPFMNRNLASQRFLSSLSNPTHSSIVYLCSLIFLYRIVKTQSSPVVKRICFHINTKKNFLRPSNSNMSNPELPHCVSQLGGAPVIEHTCCNRFKNLTVSLYASHFISILFRILQSFTPAGMARTLDRG